MEFSGQEREGVIKSPLMNLNSATPVLDPVLTVITMITLHKMRRVNCIMTSLYHVACDELGVAAAERPGQRPRCTKACLGC